VRLHARIRTGRNGDTKHRMLHVYTDLIVRVAWVLVDDVMVSFIETSFENIIGISKPTSFGGSSSFIERRGSVFPKCTDACF